MGNSSLNRNRSHSNKNSTFYNNTSSISHHNLNEIAIIGSGGAVGIGQSDTTALINTSSTGNNAANNYQNTNTAIETLTSSAINKNGLITKSKSNSLLARTSKVTIPYERWIKCDCKKWGHFKDFDFYNLTAVNPANVSSSNNTAAHSGNIIIAIDKHTNPQNNTNTNTNKLTNNSLNLASCDFASTTSTTNSGVSAANTIVTTNNAMSTNNSLSISNSYFISANLNQYLNTNLNNTNNNASQTILSFENKNNCNLGPSNSNMNINSNNNSSSSSSSNTNYGPLHYINGSFFKPIERLGDSQFILSQWPLNDIIVTVPCNIERYKANDKAAKDTAARLNRVIGVCEQFVVFQIWKGIFPC